MPTRKSTAHSDGDKVAKPVTPLVDRQPAAGVFAAKGLARAVHSPAGLLHLQRTLGNRRVTRLLGRQRPQNPGAPTIQRIKVPDLPEGIENYTTGIRVDKGKLYRNHLLALKWFLVTKHQTGSDIFTGVEAELAKADDKIDPATVRALTTEARKFGQGKETAVAEESAALDESATAKFAGIANAAIVLVDTVVGDDGKLETAFGKGEGTVAKAKGNFAAIKALISEWRDKSGELVQINKASASYRAYCMRSAKPPTLMVAKDAFDGDAQRLAFTIIHEASHGAVKTDDLGYMEQSYFPKLRDDLALKNADNYAYAAMLGAGKGGDIGADAGGDGGASVEAAVRQGASLADYKLGKLNRVLTWMLDKYTGVKRGIAADTKEKNEEIIDAGGTSDDYWTGDYVKPIIVERTAMLKEAVGTVKHYASAAPIIVAGKQVTLGSVGGGTKDIVFDLNDTPDATGMADVIFEQILMAYSMSAKESRDLSKWGNDIFDNMMQDAAHQDLYRISAAEKQLFNILKS